MLQFTEFNLQKANDNDILRIYGVWNDRSPLLVELNGKPSACKWTKSLIVYLVFISDSSGRSQGFTGIFMNAGGVETTNILTFFLSGVLCVTISRHSSLDRVQGLPRL